ncbi:MAG TPA: helix-turn-helix transcriptional regulator [Pyrinomonadaceae bacterium]|jgi:transcriptional regulator with XRE-family HTH domain
MGRSRRAQPRRLAEKLLEIRNRLDLSQSQMVRRLGEAGETLQPGHISEFESGAREPSLLVLLQYSRMAGVPMEALVDDVIDLPKRLPSEVISEWIMIKRERPIRH